MVRSSIFAIGLVPLSAQASILYDQTVGATSGLVSSSWVSPDGTDADTYAYDNFQLAADSKVKDIYWRGGFGLGIGGTVDSFTVRFYSSITGGSQPLITALPTEEKAANYLAGYSIQGDAEQSLDGSGSFFNYHFTLPSELSLSGGTPYWIKIEAAQSSYPNWGLIAGTNGDGGHITYYTGLFKFLRAPGDSAFRLEGATSSVPEPSSIALLAVGLSMMVSRRRRANS